jgi:3-oxoacyl-[acyl-carrier-protein] synthase III
MTIYSKISGTGSYLPKKCMSNQDMEKVVDTSDEWIVARTGIKQRYIAADDQSASDLAYEASLQAIKAAGITANDIDLIIVATSTPDMVFPSTAALLQNKLGIKITARRSTCKQCAAALFMRWRRRINLFAPAITNAHWLSAQKFFRAFSIGLIVAHVCCSATARVR